MSLDPTTIPAMQAYPDRTSPEGILRRFFAGWQRWEAAMDYGPFDYTNDRVRELEVRIEQLEQRLAAALEDPHLQT